MKVAVECKYDIGQQQYITYIYMYRKRKDDIEYRTKQHQSGQVGQVVCDVIKLVRQIFYNCYKTDYK